MRPAAAIVLAALAMGGCGDDEPMPASTPPSTLTTETVAPPRADEGISDAAQAPSNQAEPVRRPPSVKQTIRSAITSVDPGEGFRKIRVSGSKAHGYVVLIRFELSDNLTRGLRRAGVERDMRDLYEAIYTSPRAESVNNVQIEAVTQLVDALGNEREGSAFTTSLDGDIGAAVNWENVDSLDFNDIWTQEFKIDDF